MKRWICGFLALAITLTLAGTVRAEEVSIKEIDCNLKEEIYYWVNSNLPLPVLL